MADKTIDELVAASTVGDNDLLVLQQSGTAKKLSGKKLGDFVYAAAAEKVAEVETAVAGAQAAINQLEAQKNTIAQTVASMAQLGTDTTLTTSGMAADAKAVGDKFLNSLVDYKQVNTYSSCDDIEKDSIIAVGSTAGRTSIPDFPYTRPGWIWTIVWTEYLKMQIVFPWSPEADHDILFRVRNFNGWQPWMPIRYGTYDYAKRSTESNLNGALFLHRLTENYSSYNISVTYNKDREMYHISGSPDVETYASINFAYSNYHMDTDLGLIPGKRYNFVFELSPSGTGWTDSVSKSIAKVAIYINYSTNSANWVFQNKWDPNTLFEYEIPSSAVGFLIRAEFLPGTNFNHDFALHATEFSVVSSGMVRSFMEKFGFSVRNSTPIPYNSSCDDVATCGTIFNSTNGSNVTFRDFPLAEPGWLISIPDYSYGHMVQFAIGWNSRSIKYRSSKFNVWGNWLTLGDSAGSLLPSCDVSTIKAPGFYLLADSQTYTSTPDNRGTGFLETLEASGWTTQIFYGLRDNKVWKRTLEGSGTVGTWTLIGGGARDVIQNTYTINTSPTITSSTNGWLAAVDDETTTESDATDMTGAIMSMLTDTGYCHLGPGTFYVSGSIDMPYGSTLEGCGEKTIVRLLSSVSSGYIVRPFQRSTIRGIKFSGGTSVPTNLFTDGSDLGSRHGIYCHGNADGEGSTEPVFDNCIITDCWFENFDGSAFYAYNTGGGISQGVMMTDCFVIHSRVGINIDYFFEYAKFTSCIVRNCYYACINNGGNIVLTGCTFHGVVGMLCDNTNNDKRNNTHGSIVGCTFNHIDNMNHPELGGGGIAIHMINCANDEIITGCQFWYGNLLIENCAGVAFSDCLFGNNAITITVTGTSPAFFFNNIFHNAPVLSVNSASKFDRNYTKAGSLVEPL